MLELSVIVPVYNMAKDGNLTYCINSLVRQTLQSMEIIAVDDASTDDSLKILQEFEKNIPEELKQLRPRRTGDREAQEIWDCGKRRDVTLGLWTRTTGSLKIFMNECWKLQSAREQMLSEQICAGFMNIR